MQQKKIYYWDVNPSKNASTWRGKKWLTWRCNRNFWPNTTTRIFWNFFREIEKHTQVTECVCWGRNFWPNTSTSVFWSFFWEIEKHTQVMQCVCWVRNFWPNTNTSTFGSFFLRNRKTHTSDEVCVFLRNRKTHTSDEVCVLGQKFLSKHKHKYIRKLFFWKIEKHTQVMECVCWGRNFCPNTSTSTFWSFFFEKSKNTHTWWSVCVGSEISGQTQAQVHFEAFFRETEMHTRFTQVHKWWLVLVQIFQHKLDF